MKNYQPHGLSHLDFGALGWGREKLNWRANRSSPSRAEPTALKSMVEPLQSGPAGFGV